MQVELILSSLGGWISDINDDCCLSPFVVVIYSFDHAILFGQNVAGTYLG